VCRGVHQTGRHDPARAAQHLGIGDRTELAEEHDPAVFNQQVAADPPW